MHNHTGHIGQTDKNPSNNVVERPTQLICIFASSLPDGTSISSGEITVEEMAERAGSFGLNMLIF